MCIFYSLYVWAYVFDLSLYTIYFHIINRYNLIVLEYISSYLVFKALKNIFCFFWALNTVLLWQSCFKSTVVILLAIHFLPFHSFCYYLYCTAWITCLDLFSVTFIICIWTHLTLIKNHSKSEFLHFWIFELHWNVKMIIMSAGILVSYTCYSKLQHILWLY